jgi:hypothetical protein
MPTVAITTSAKFNKSTDLYLPLAVASPQSFANQTAPDNAAALNDLCAVVERELLLNALGATIYSDLQTALNLPGFGTDGWAADQKWKDMVNGCSYDDKIWEGLSADKSFIAYAVYCAFLNDLTFVTPLGVAQPGAENLVTPAYKIATASQKFIKKYQGGYCADPVIIQTPHGSLLDYYGAQDDVDVSFYRFLTDNAATYGWTGEFRAYEAQNSFGL